MERLNFSLAKAYRHIKESDPNLARVIDDHARYKPRPTHDPYGQLVRGILGQQLSGAAVNTIRRRFFEVYGDEEIAPTPEQILKTKDAVFHSAGVSRQKMSYLRDLAKHVHKGEFNFENLDDLSNEHIIERLTSVKGIGEWTVHMYLMLHLGRPNVLPTGDLGVQKGMKITYNLRKLPTPKHMKQIAAPWEPYRSVGSWHMWQVADTVIPD